MSLYTSTELEGLRKDMASLIDADACTITRIPGGASACGDGLDFDPGTGLITIDDQSASQVTIYTGVCRFNPVLFRREGGEFVRGQGFIRIRDYRVHIPFPDPSDDSSAPDIHLDDVFVLTASNEVHALARPMVIDDVVYQSETGVIRLVVKDQGST